MSTKSFFHHFCNKQRKVLSVWFVLICIFSTYLIFFGKIEVRAQRLPINGVQNNPLKLPTKTFDNIQKLNASHFKQPLSFESNRGQLDPKIKFLGRGFGYDLFLTSDEVLMIFNKSFGFNESKPQQSIKKNLTNFSSSLLRMKFVGANTDPNIEGAGENSSRSNYLLGKEKTIEVRWFNYSREKTLGKMRG